MDTTQSIAARDATSEYRKLVAALASRAVRIGSRDAEGAAHETLRRSLANPVSRAAVEYYLRERLPELPDPPSWSLEQLFGWLYAVLRLVVREESARVSFRREVLTIDADTLDVRDPSPDQLDLLLDSELQTIVRESLSALSEEYRSVLILRAQGLKYAEIAAHLGVNPNTVATRLRRATQAVARQVRGRTEYQPYAAVAEQRE